jgi:predicted  nucleic acid-binding Zn-ribbon protein
MTMAAPRGDELGELTTGDEETQATPGSLVCVECGYALSLERQDTLPACPACGGDTFRRASLFDRATREVDAVEARTEPAAVREARDDLRGSGPHLAWVAPGGEVDVFPLAVGWTRIGRSGSADVRLDDPTVSRRHALVVVTEEGAMRALDDRSLNGLFVNGSRVEWAPLSDGDELEIGRFRIYLLT